MQEIENKPQAQKKVEEAKLSGHDDSFPYMDLEIDRGRLLCRDEILKLLSLYGATDSTLDRVRNTYGQRFSQQLIWKYPFSDDMQGGGVIIPVQEGFLFLPYKTVFENAGAKYQLDNAEILTAAAIHTLQEECRAYTDGLLSALGEMESAIRPRPARRYLDTQGNLYFVRPGIGEVYKGFRRYANPKQGQRRESGIRGLHYVESFEQAQLELDQYAQKHHLRPADGKKAAQGDL